MACSVAQHQQPWGLHGPSSAHAQAVRTPLAAAGGFSAPGVAQKSHTAMHADAQLCSGWPAHKAEQRKGKGGPPACVVERR